jgi:mannose-6-phosphate isomerase-like protein (cupin superfamily)
MNEIEQLSQNMNYDAIDLGNLDELMDYSLIHPVNKQKVDGKVFLKKPTNATGSEISFNCLPAKSELPYFHIHTKNEETYIVLKGRGFFQVDDDCFDIKEGSVIRVAPEGKRGICNTSNDSMTYIVVQSKEHSLEEYTTDDGKRLPVTPKWKI